MQNSQAGFKCAHCGKFVPFIAPGTHNRNHCPFCLYSLHVDIKTGDRNSPCGGLMPAVGKMYKAGGEEALIHKCQKCGILRKNRVAVDDTIALVEGLAVIKQV